MDREDVAQVYEAVCAKHGTKTNPHVVEVLEKTTETKKFTVKLAGNDRARLSDEDVHLLCQCLRSRCVTGLDLSYNSITDEGAGHVAHLLQEEKSTLRLLDLRFNDVLTDGAEVLNQSLRCNSTLLSLRLSGNKIGNRGAMHLAGMLQVNSSLQELELADCDLATQSVIALTVVLKSNKALRSVDISRPLLFSHQEEWAVHCSEMLAANRSLVELHLGKMGMTDTGMERLTEGLKLNRSLRYLDLRCNRVTRDGACHLADVLKQNPTLEIVDLSSNRIEDEGAVYLSEAITWPGCSLRENVLVVEGSGFPTVLDTGLSVNSNGIRTEGLLSLTEAMKTNTTLTHIYIWGNHLEEPVCQAFRELISSSRLLPEHTDVSAYEVDGQVFLAEVSQKLRRRYYSADGSGTETCSDSDSSFPPHTDHQQLVPLQPC